MSVLYYLNLEMYLLKSVKYYQIFVSFFGAREVDHKVHLKEKVSKKNQKYPEK